MPWGTDQAPVCHALKGEGGWTVNKARGFQEQARTRWHWAQGERGLRTAKGKGGLRKTSGQKGRE